MSKEKKKKPGWVKVILLYFGLQIDGMFSSLDRLRRKTPANGIDRKEFIRLLVDEYHETTNVGKY